MYVELRTRRVDLIFDFVRIGKILTHHRVELLDSKQLDQRFGVLIGCQLGRHHAASRVFIDHNWHGFVLQLIVGVLVTDAPFSMIHRKKLTCLW